MCAARVGGVLYLDGVSAGMNAGMAVTRDAGRSKMSGYKTPPTSADGGCDPFDTLRVCDPFDTRRESLSFSSSS